MRISLEINKVLRDIEIRPADTLLNVLRKEGYFGAKFGGCRSGECGACTVLLDGRPVNSCSILAASAEGHQIETIEAVGQHPDQGWKKTEGLSIIQQAFVDSGAIQCGYCTPAMVLAAEALLQKQPNPEEKDIREHLSGILCRCTGYIKPVQAVLRAAAIIRGEAVEDFGEMNHPGPGSEGIMPGQQTRGLGDHLVDFYEEKPSGLGAGFIEAAGNAPNLDDT